MWKNLVPERQYSYSPCCPLYIYWGADKENLSIQSNSIQFYLNSHEYSVFEKVIIITVRSVTNINIKNTEQSQKKKQNNRNNLQFIVTKDI